MTSAEINADVRPLSHRLAEDCGDLLDGFSRTPVRSAILAGSLDREGYVRLLAQMHVLHGKLDGVIVEARATTAPLRLLVSDMRLFGDLAAQDLADLGASPSDVEPVAAVAALIERIGELAMYEPFKLLGLHAGRESMRNADRYVAAKLRALMGAEPNSEAGYRFLDPFRRGQRPVWERFKRDLDKLALSEPERQSLVAAARLYYESLTAIESQVGVDAPATEPHRIPASL